MLTTFYYTFFGTVGSILFGVLAAQMVNQKFFGRTFMRSVLLFPYVGPVVALAYTWELLLDPTSGTLNSLLINFQIIENPINLLGQKYISLNFFGFDLKFRLALTTVIFFEIWRYFPLAFLFILARLQAVPKELYEAADVDGAGPLQKFTNITLPQITAVISILFMIRFIWNFNKFEDVFLLTGGASGTRTLPINVYQQGFAISDIGMGSAVSMVIVILLLLFMYLYFQLIGKKANEN
jgi:ABC-type sugar transport systems, permease components